MRTSVLLAQKTYDFSKFIVCPHGKEGKRVEPVRAFFGQGGGGHFSRFCADVFYVQSLTTAKCSCLCFCAHQTVQFLLVGAQKYFCPQAQGIQLHFFIRII